MLLVMNLLQCSVLRNISREMESRLPHFPSFYSSFRIICKVLLASVCLSVHLICKGKRGGGEEDSKPSKHVRLCPV